MTPRGNLGFILSSLEKAEGSPVEVAPGDVHTVYLPFALQHALLLRQLA